MSVSEKRWSTTEEEAAQEAPASFRAGITRDPYASIHKFDQNTLRGETPIILDDCPTGGDVVPKSGYWVDLEGKVINYYHEGNIFPKYGPVAGAGGRFFYVTGRRNATTSDMLYIILRAGYQGDIMELKTL